MKKKEITISISIITFLFIIIFLYIKGNFPQVDREKIESFVDKRFVCVSNFEESIVLKPKGRDALVGFIFYTPREVSKEYYIPIMGKVAERGFNVYILDSKNDDRKKLGEGIVLLDVEINNWVISGINEGKELSNNLYRSIKNYKNAEVLSLEESFHMDYENFNISKDKIEECIQDSSRIILKDLNKLRN